LAERLSYYGLFEWTVGSRKHQQQLWYAVKNATVTIRTHATFP
jgi:hypothetical protein